MSGARVYPAVFAAVALAGCSTGTERPVLAPPAEPRTFELGWVERYRAAGFVFRVGRLVVEEEGWRATVSVTNQTDSSYRLGPRSVGLVLLDTNTRGELQRLTDGFLRPPPSLTADRARPPPPSVLGPGASWSATLSGATVLRDGSVVRVLFGPFSRLGSFDRLERPDVHWVTDHSVRL